MQGSLGATNPTQNHASATRNRNGPVAFQPSLRSKAMPSRAKPPLKEGTVPAIKTIRASRQRASSSNSGRNGIENFNGPDSDESGSGKSRYQREETFGGDLQSIHDSLIAFAKEAGDMMTDSRPVTSSIDTKVTAVDLVTETDKAVEDLIQKRVQDKWPSYKFFGEETARVGDKLGDDPTFVCDPIDGTTNYVHGYPYVSISLGFCYKKTPLIGVVYNPFTLELFTAIKGKGSYRTTPKWGRQKLPIKRPMEPLGKIDSMLIMVEWGTDREGSNFQCKSNTINNLVKSKNQGGAMCHSCRSLGGAALNLCAVATGGIDMYWEGGLYAWDMCAGWAILLEAGGMIADANPGRWEIAVDDRMLLAVRPSPEGRGQKEAVQQLWSFVVGRLNYKP